jgi:hypothetical protein
MSDKKQTAEEAAKELARNYQSLLRPGDSYDEDSYVAGCLAGVEWSRQNDMRAIDDAIARFECLSASLEDTWASKFYGGMMQELKQLRGKYAGGR